MPEIAIRDILINARQEAFRMQHFYMGVEHLFIALLELQGGLTVSLMERRGLTPEYVIDAIRRQTGKGTRQRLWAGMPHTPRADTVIGIANDLALEEGRQEISERDLLLAILAEGDSVPTRALKKLGVSIDSLQRDIDSHVDAIVSRQSSLTIELAQGFDPAEITNDHRIVLRRMFYGYSSIRLERQLTGGYSSALVMIVTPIGDDAIEDSPVVVKIDDADIILDEAARYEQHIKASLPPLTARLEDTPATVETSTLAGLKYTFVPNGDGEPQDLRIASGRIGGLSLGEWLEQALYPYFGRTWWMQRRPFRFQAWTEYDWLLPPLLTVEYQETPGSDAYTIRDPIRRGKLRTLLRGDTVAIEDFTVKRVYRDQNAIQIAIGKGSEAARRAFKIEIRGLNLAQDAYYRSEIVEQIGGRIVNTRDDLLRMAVETLDPDFALNSPVIPGFDDDQTLPNPLYHYDDLLDSTVNGSLSKIHGDLHLGNILVGINASPFLIDFAQTRSGHTVFDWACLEISLLNDVVAPAWESSWRDVRTLAGALNTLHNTGGITTLPARSQQLLESVAAVQRIVAQSLAEPDRWGEYYTSLFFCALRATTWDTISIGARRLAFYVAALCLHYVKDRSRAGSTPDTLSHDATDII